MQNKLMRRLIGAMVNNNTIKNSIKAIFGKTKLYRKLQYEYYENNQDSNHKNAPVIVYRESEIENVLRNMSMAQLKIFLDIVNNDGKIMEDYSDENCN